VEVIHRVVNDENILKYIENHPKNNLFVRPSFKLPDMIKYLYTTDDNFRLLLQDNPAEVWDLQGIEENVDFGKETDSDHESVAKDVDGIPNEDL